MQADGPRPLDALRDRVLLFQQWQDYLPLAAARSLVQHKRALPFRRLQSCLRPFCEKISLDLSEPPEPGDHHRGWP